MADYFDGPCRDSPDQELLAISGSGGGKLFRRGAETGTLGTCAPQKSAADTAATTAQTTSTPSVAVR